MHEKHLKRAVDLAREHMQLGHGGPFGAVVVRDGQVIGEGWNAVTTGNDPTAHAEVMAIRAACTHVQDHRLAGATLYASCEPCPMCLAAAWWARVDRVVFSASREEAARAGFDDAMIYEEIALPLEQRRLEMRCLHRELGQAVLEEWTRFPDKIPY